MQRVQSLLCWRLAITVTVTVTIAYFLVPPDAQPVLGGVFGMLGVAGIVAGIARYRPADARPWWFLALGMLTWATADIAWSAAAVAHGGEPPFPSWYDALYLASYPLLGAGVWLAAPRFKLGSTLDGIVLVTAGVVPLWAFVAEEYLASGTELGVTVVSLAYPFGDLLLLVAVVHLMLNGAGALAPARFVSLALAAALVADFGYSVLVIDGSYTAGHWIDAGWMVMYGGFAAAALHPRMADFARLETTAAPMSYRPRLVLLGVAAVSVPVVHLLDLDDDLADTVTVLGAVTVICLLIVVRLGSTIAALHRRTDALSTALRERDKLNARLHHASQHDALTRLANRDLFAERVGEALEACHGRVALAFCDLDDFKNVNDEHGHGFGDELLTEVAQRLASVARAGDTVARLGGDEFGVVWRDVRDPAEAQRLGQRLLRVMSTPFTSEGRTLSIGMSVGIALGRDGVSYSELLSNADIAGYAAKRGGRNRVELFHEEMRVALLGPARLADRLATALADGRLVTAFQPIVDLRTGEMAAAEALVRWPDEGPRTDPTAFLQAATDHGLIESVDLYVLREALDCVARWNGAGPRVVSVNASPQWLVQDDFVDQVLRVLAETGVPPQRLMVELTEYALHGDETVVAANLARLRDVGVAVALDDFGTGYASLSYLQRFRADRLKIDRSIIATISGDEPPALVSAVVALAHALGIGVVAEGVETEAQLAVLRDIGCDYVQGYLVGRPLLEGQLHASFFGALSGHHLPA